jgi:hypothetical protein
VLRNFISNAIKFTSRGEVRVMARLKDSTIEFAVADTGVGISPSDQQIIFEEFGQVENSMQRRVKGTGLGLPLSRKLAELLGGTVTVQSEVGIGSTFFFVVPLIYSGARMAQRSLRASPRTSLIPCPPSSGSFLCVPSSSPIRKPEETEWCGKAAPSCLRHRS